MGREDSRAERKRRPECSSWKNAYSSNTTRRARAEREFARASRVALAPLTHLSSAALMLS